MTDLTMIAIALAAGYLAGSIPFGLILTRAAGLGDVRSIGSGNIGATNVLRTGRKGLAAATLLCDALKGTIPVVALGAAFGMAAGLAAGLGAFLGHLFPVWLGFKGGKGVATYIGVLLGVVWPAVLVFAGIWLLVAAVFRYSSLAALTATALVPPSLWLLDQPQAAALFALLSVVTWIKHQQNIRRLLAGTESRIGSKT